MAQWTQTDTIKKLLAENERLETELNKVKPFPTWLGELVAIFGWQGGTIWQALDEVKILKDKADKYDDLAKLKQ